MFWFVPSNPSPSLPGQGQCQKTLCSEGTWWHKPHVHFSPFLQFLAFSLRVPSARAFSKSKFSHCQTLDAQQKAGWMRRHWISSFGAPRFSVQRPRNPYSKGFRERFGAGIWGAPQADPKTTDPNLSGGVPPPLPP